MGDRVSDSLGEGIRWDPWDKQYARLHKYNNPRSRTHDDAGNPIGNLADDTESEWSADDESDRVVLTPHWPDVLDKIRPYSPKVTSKPTTYRTDVEGDYDNSSAWSREEQARVVEGARQLGIPKNRSTRRVIKELQAVNDDRKYSDHIRPDVDRIASHPPETFVDEGLVSREHDHFTRPDIAGTIEDVVHERKKARRRRQRSLEKGFAAMSLNAGKQDSEKTCLERVRSSSVLAIRQSESMERIHDGSDIAASSLASPKWVDWKPQRGPPLPAGMTGLSPYSVRQARPPSRSGHLSSQPNQRTSRSGTPKVWVPKDKDIPFKCRSIDPVRPALKRPVDDLHERLETMIEEQGYPRITRTDGSHAVWRYPCEAPSTYRPFTKDYMTQAWRATITSRTPAQEVGESSRGRSRTPRSGRSTYHTAGRDRGR
jgi:hypothetical protein